jgi:hypothetical protein
MIGNWEWAWGNEAWGMGHWEKLSTVNYQLSTINCYIAEGIEKNYPESDRIQHNFDKIKTLQQKLLLSAEVKK